jgi:hypothetical protein
MARWSAIALASLAARAAAYTVPLKDDDYSRQTCSGMWSGPNTSIEISFNTPASQGQLAMVVYEWTDVEYLGKTTSQEDETLPVRLPWAFPNQLIHSHLPENIRLHIRCCSEWLLQCEPAGTIHP